MSEPVKDNLAIRFRKLCRNVEYVNGQSKATLSSSPEGVEIVRLLRGISSDISKRSSSEHFAQLIPHISRGRGSLPRVLWVAFTKHGSPYSSLSVALCFGIDGNGAVCGLMDSAGAPTSKVLPIIRNNGNLMPLVNVDGPNPSTYYNNKFFNPLEFFREDINTTKLINHIDESLNLLMSTDI